MTNSAPPAAVKMQDNIQTSEHAHYGLRPNVLNHFETLAQSISCLAPIATPAILIPLVFASAGNGTWLAYVIATIGVVLVGANINQFASRSASPGSIYSYAAIGLGPAVGILTGWLLLCAYVVVISCLGAEFAVYAKPFIEQVAHISIEPVVLMLFSTGIAGYIAWRDIKLSASLMLIIEACSVALISFVVAMAFWHHGSLIDWQQIRLFNVSPHALSMGLVLAIFGYTGFESAASLVSDAKDPLTNIPKAVMRSGLWSGIFYIVCAYAMILAFSGCPETLDKCATPLATFAAYSGVPGLGIFLTAGAIISFFACTLACINTGSRLIFMMAHHGLFHSQLAIAHEINQTPHLAILICSIIGIIPALLLSLAHYSLMDIIAWTGTISSYGFIFSYALVSLAAPAYLYQLKELKLWDLLMAGLGFGAMCIFFIGNIDPNATGISQYLPYVFGALVLIGIIWYAALKVWAPETVKLLTDDMEAIKSRFIKGEAL